MKIVLDTNVWISGLMLPQSKAGDIIKKWKEGKFIIVTSKPILDEIRRVLLYPKIFKKIGWNREEIDFYLESLSFFTETVSFNKVSVKVEKDPHDAPILETLIKSNADFLVTGDKVLLDFQSSFAILSVSDFHGMIE
ncbi:MAG: putative toxin-antitoxin system toxin component, PIN family [Alphaproteobacteria bacterium 16-39-46]|nr:MAG: putative toxin-antitoxin system toxin component, PIN family [Alphaproteobacteria bacterium 16-39-46]OZA43546.1 MAG: putative toxin-antitoxin system toxin component, PIN family [Alphaproteobacteria bacterium 17-39-52]HQS83803.1 putative toxin-antitoxin system toxin component, PIN family [Alphaproteobacteria bacterium]HQS93586.1 putative toxin-antitoxin system toxin component, PIN family [Alphaproteobacteria bacterium]